MDKRDLTQMGRRKVVASEARIPDDALERLLLDLVNAHVSESGDGGTKAGDDAGRIFRTAAAGWNPGIGGAEPGSILDHSPLPAPDGEGQATAEPPKPATTLPSHATDNKPNGTPVTQCAAAAKAPAKATKKPLLDPEKYRKARGPAAEEPFSDGAQTTIPVRKPGKRNFFRVHPDEGYRLYNVPVVEDDSRELHILAPDLEIPEDLERFVSHVNLVTCLSHKGTLFLWPYRNSTND
jgi:hypothetical protein